MSSSTDQKSPAGLAGANGQRSRIVHFDATLRRKEKMRLKATNETEHANVPQTITPNASEGVRKPVGRIPSNGAAKPAAPVPMPAAGPASAVPVAANAMSPEELESFLINFVVEQTGYPTEMVELDADLEADLGIDSIKKAQLFGELAEHFDVRGGGELSLDDFPTLRHVVNFLAGPCAKKTPASSESEAARSASPAVVTRESAADPPPSAALIPAAQDDIGDLASFLVNFVVEQTGYPQEMVELDADLEADLGIDSIKKAQLFGELAEHFDLRATGELSLDDFPTLRHVLNALSRMPSRPAESPATASLSETSTPQATAAAAAPLDNLDRFLIDFVVEQTGYPPEMVELDADLEADLGIDSIKKAQLFGELAERFEVGSAGNLTLDDFPTLRHVLEFLEGVPRKISV